MRDSDKIAIQEMGRIMCKPPSLFAANTAEDILNGCYLAVKFAERLYLAGYRKQSEDVPDTNVGCKFCEDDYSLDNLVCYIPTDDGASIDPPVRYCPFCGAKMKGD